MLTTGRNWKCTYLYVFSRFTKAVLVTFNMIDEKDEFVFIHSFSVKSHCYIAEAVTHSRIGLIFVLPATNRMTT